MQTDEAPDQFVLEGFVPISDDSRTWLVTWEHVETAARVVRRLTQEEFEASIEGRNEKPTWTRAEIEAIGVPEDEAG